MPNLTKKSGENKNKLRRIHPKNHENFQKSLGSSFTGSNEKNECNKFLTNLIV